MVYGHYIEDTAGNKRFFVEGCTHCSISTGGQHESHCPNEDTKISDIPARIPNIRATRDTESLVIA